MKKLLCLFSLTIALSTLSLPVNAFTPQTRPTPTQIDEAVRQSKVLIGMTQQDVWRAWGKPGGGKGFEAAKDGEYEVWYFYRANVYFKEGLVVSVRMIR